MGVRIRRSVWELSVGSVTAAATDPWDPVLHQMERAIAALRQLPDADPRSWMFLANTHQADPAVATPGGALWRQCAHGLLTFLPWHRAYLRWFESVIQDEIGGVEGAAWALPFWGYDLDAPATARRLPPELVVETRTIDGQVVDNALFTDQRRSDLISPTQPGELDPTQATAVAAMANVRYAEAYPEVGFGGRLPPSAAFGDLEQTPHNDIHVAFSPGLMDHPYTAAQDPVFWMHHANIDRLWEVWLSAPWALPIPQDPDVPANVRTAWASARFAFGLDTAPARYAMAELEDISSPRLDYTYGQHGTMSPALEAAARALQTARGGGPLPAADDATAAPPPPHRWTATGEATDVSVPADGAERRIGHPTAHAFDDTPPAGLLISLEGIEAVDPAPQYVVGVQVADDAPIHLAGSFSTFGLSSQEEPAAVSIDASDLVTALVADGWSGGPLVVRVRPRGARSLDDDAPDAGDLTLGAVVVFTR